METKNLLLRPFRAEDRADFIALIRDKMASEYSVYDEQFPTDEASLVGLLAYFSQSEEFFAVELKQAHRAIGFVSLNFVDADTRNLGYCIHTAYQRKGCASEAVSAMIEYAKTHLHAKKLICGTAERNIPSVRLLKKMGFTVTGRGEGSFAKGADGQPILFTGCSFERTL